MSRLEIACHFSKSDQWKKPKINTPENSSPQPTYTVWCDDLLYHYDFVIHVEEMFFVLLLLFIFRIFNWMLVQQLFYFTEVDLYSEAHSRLRHWA